MKKTRYPRRRGSWLPTVAGLGLAVLSAAPTQAAAAELHQLPGLATVPCALTVTQTPLAEVFARIERQTGYQFLYVDQTNLLSRKISVDAPHSNLSAVLQLVGAQAGVEFTQQQKRLVVKPVAPKTVKGRVVDAKGEGLPGVSIRVKDSSVGTTTNLDGSFQLAVEPGSVLLISFIGYAPQQLTVDDKSTYDVVLREDATSLDEVVVTALGIKREEKALGYSVTQLSTEQLTEAKSNNWTDALSGKVAGVNLVRSGGGPAGSNKIILRGENSLAGDNDALVVVDGVVLGGSNRNTGNGSTAYLQTESPVDFGTSLNDINPEDIESVSVLKGPAATALYGARGGNGAILITTKSGKLRKKGIGVTFNSNTAFETISRWPDYQYEYGQGTVGENFYSFGATADGPSTRSTSSAWGPRFEGQSFFQYDPATHTGSTERTPWVPYKNNRKDFFETGRTFTNTISIDGGNERTAFRLSLTNLKNTWIIPNTGYDRNTVALSVSHKITDRLQVSTKVNYTNRFSDNLPSTGYNNQTIMYWSMLQVPNGNLDWLKDYWVPGAVGVTQRYPFSSLVDNPYLITYEMLNKSNRNSLTGNVQVNYKFTKDLNLMVRSTLDFSYEARSQQRPKDTEKYKDGMYRTQNVFSQEINHDFLLQYSHQFGKFATTLSAGGSRLRNRYLKDELRAERLLYPQVFTFANSRDLPISLPYRAEFAVNGLYGLATIAYNKFLYLDLTARKDWSSTLAGPNGIEQIPLYPSASLSTILSEILPLPQVVSFAKLRGSWAEVGSGSTTPYLTSYTYAVATGFASGLSNPSTIANPDLKPRRTRSVELGADLRFWQNRIGLDVAVYRNNTFDQILEVPLDRASGYDRAALNAGLVRNQGLEVQANATVITNPTGFNWKLYGTYTANRNEVVELADSVFTYQIQRGPGGRGTVEARPGGNMGAIYGRGYLRAPDGQIIYENGYPLLGDEVKYLGSALPKWKGSVGTEFAYKQFRLNVLVDGQFGAKAYSMSHAVLAEQGKTKNTLPGRYNGIIGNGVVQNADGSFSPNDVVAENIWTYYTAHYGRDNVEANLFRTDFIKLREVRLDYSVPATVLRKIKLERATIGLYGRDLFIISNWPAFDPEFGTLNNGTIDAGFELGQFPSTRTIGINLTVGI
ncbi:SusC/RagA family TonB-linked outer membrane protein [Hymenobacter sp. BT186]|uniref:SusC/RagA family TonB-linked outer membrane protein n=1 Tax=Hymenobacter telluris TaxID=2816474 RepID=A0A939EYM0_9BACT|nr:SusC/RagA family TonB-linked outer membrane protein [Hymenobacter telluris]MBO0360224.1 SusC/RagA family TonB-linked outer membrane protein [Hymenobacter telluris]MBW3376251.1 SusC/RagA family TonB-linked outer membrane protein [Hymenobacter norwichensis]